MHRCSYCSRFVYIPQGVDVVMMNIDEPTPIPLQDDATQEEIITKVFEKRAGRLAVFAGNDLALCLRYQAARWGGLRNEIKHRNKVAYSLLGKTTVDFIATVVTGLEENQERRALLKEISSFLEQGSQDKDSLNSAAAILLQLCVRVWLMCEIPVIPPRFPTTWQTYSNSRRWLNDTQTLRQHLLSCFPKTSTASENAILERSFQLYNIQKVANIAIIWTDDILEHLRVRDPTHDSEPYTVSVFHHRRFLEYHAARSSTLFPDGLIVETIKTLDLLLPFEHKDTREWYIKLAAVKRLDETACKISVRWKQRTA